MLGQVWEVPCPVWHGPVPGDEGRVSEQAEGEDAPQLYACYGTGLSSTGPKVLVYLWVTHKRFSFCRPEKLALHICLFLAFYHPATAKSP